MKSKTKVAQWSIAQVMQTRQMLCAVPVASFRILFCKSCCRGFGEATEVVVICFSLAVVACSDWQELFGDCAA